MNFDQLTTLDVVVRAGTISKAAEKVFKTQPAISMAIKRLEQEVGFAIFDRRGYRLELTEKGRIYYDKSQAILTQMNQLQNLTQSFKNGEEPQVDIAVEAPTNQISILSKIKPVQAQFPNTILNIEGTNLLYSLQKLVQHKVDLAISPWLDVFEFEGDFDSKVIDQYAITLCGHKDLFKPFGITKAEDIDAEVLSKLPQLAPAEMGLELPDRFITKYIGTSLIHANDVQTVLAALKAKLGWGPIVDSWWTEDMADDFFQFQPDIEQPPITGQVRIIKNRNTLLGPVAQAIWDVL